MSLQIQTCLQSTMKVCSKIIGLPVRPLSTVCEQQTLRPPRDPSGSFRTLPHSVPNVWEAPLRMVAQLPGLKNTEKESNLCSQGCSAPTLPSTRAVVTKIHSFELNWIVARKLCLFWNPSTPEAPLHLQFDILFHWGLLEHICLLVYCPSRWHWTPTLDIHVFCLYLYVGWAGL